MIFTDTVTGAIERALTGVAERQRVSANNIANVATPGFRASRLDFEANLAAALHAGHPETAGFEITDAGGAPRADGNTVSLEDETATLIRSGLQFDTLVAALNHKLGLLRSAIGRR